MGEIWNTSLVDLGSGNVLTVGKLIVALAVILAGFVLSSIISRLIARRLGKGSTDANVVVIIQRLSFFVLLAVVMMTGLSMLQIPLTAFAFLSGAVAIGVGFGAQNIINNFISGWILMSERPVRIGDFIEIDDSKGIVERIGNRSTRIRRVDGVHLLVPNSMILEQVVVNWTLVDHELRTRVAVGVAYGSPTRKVAELIEQAVLEHPDILKEPEHRIFFDDFGDSALVFEVLFWCEQGTEGGLRRIQSEIRFRLDELFRDAGIVIAFPQQDVHLDSQTPIEVRMVAGPEDRG
ncbi:MAG: mechanosensitive ion channel family protein [Alphaproteobacteria bacterium]